MSEQPQWQKRLETIAERLRQTQMGKEWTRRTADADIIEIEVIPLIHAALAANDEKWRDRFRKFQKVEDKFGPASQRKEAK
jgi:hypothetical protein